MTKYLKTECQRKYTWLREMDPFLSAEHITCHLKKVCVVHIQKGLIHIDIHNAITQFLFLLNETRFVLKIRDLELWQNESVFTWFSCTSHKLHPQFNMGCYLNPYLMFKSCSMSGVIE
jgi:hypothetical protein